MTDANPPPPTSPAAPHQDKGAYWEFFNLYSGAGCLLGIGAGIWAATTNRIVEEESTVLLAAAGAAIGLLAVAVTAMTLVIAFFEGNFGRFLGALGTRRFFLPFVVVAAVSAVDALVCFAGALDSGGGGDPSTHASKISVVSTGVGPVWTRDVLFGIAAWLLVWALAGVIKLVRSLVSYAEQRARFLAAIRPAPDPVKPDERTAPPPGSAPPGSV
jgi:hypothetical protein